MNPSDLFIILPILFLIVGATVAIIGYRKWRAKGIALGIAVFCVLYVVLIPTIIPAAILSSFNDPAVIAARESAAQGLNEAYLGVRTVLKQLPTLENAEQLLISTTGRSNGETGCAHAWVDVLYGTSLAPAIISDKYVQQLQSVGWLSNDVKQESSRELTRGENTQFSIEYGGDYADYWKQQGYEKEYLPAAKKYVNVLNTRIDFFVPSRAKCAQ